LPTFQGNSQQTKEFAHDMTVEFHGQDPETYKPDVDTSNVSLFMPQLIEYIKYFVQVLSTVLFPGWENLTVIASIPYTSG
jgi:hypothetical protein